jgi:3-isopropylmalate dehydrogenase
MPGDGVGPEVVENAVRVLHAVAGLEAISVSLTEYPHSTRYREPDGSQISEATIDEIGGHDAMLFGAQGGSETGLDAVAERPLIAIGNRLHLTLGVRPVRLYAPGLTPLRAVVDPFDVLLVRDVSEDCYVGPGGVAHLGSEDEVSAGLMIYTRACVDGVLRYALAAAQRRRGIVDLVTQVEGVAAHRIWHRRLAVVAPEFPGVEVRTMLPDTAASRLVEDPAYFDVIATTYWLGGILSNLMATVAGGVGLMPSARINPDRRFALFEPAHGTAPKHVGRATVSPIATIRAVGMLLDFVGETTAATRLERAVAAAFAAGRIPSVTTRSGLSTGEVTDAVLAQLENPS